MKLVVRILAALLLIGSAAAQSATPAQATNSTQTTTLTCTQTYSSTPQKVNPFEIVLNPSAKTVQTVAFFDGAFQDSTLPATFTSLAITWKESGMGITETDILNPMTDVLTSTVTNGMHFAYQCKPTAK